MWTKLYFNAEVLPVYISNFSNCSMYVLTRELNVQESQAFFGPSIVFEEKYSSHLAAGYNFQAESRSPCNLKKKNKKYNLIPCWRKMVSSCHTLMGVVPEGWARHAGMISEHSSSVKWRSGRWIGQRAGAVARAGRFWDLKFWYIFSLN